MDTLQIFKHELFGSIRTVTKDRKVLFCGSDVARSLGYAIPSKAINTHCNRQGVSKIEVPTNGGNQEMLFITEGNLYRLITHSKLDGAEKFESWVFDDVLPTIRKHGMYATNQKLEEMLSDPDTMIKTLQVLKQEREARKALEQQIEANKPKVIFADAVSASNTSILVGELAKILKQNGLNMGQNRLFEKLRKDGYLISRKGTDYNMPTQRSMELGLFSIKETAVTHSDGHVSVNKTPKITGKGQQYFISKLMNKAI